MGLKKITEMQVQHIPAEKIFVPKERARIQFDREKLDELKADINKNGLLQNLIVKSVRGGYEIVAGDRRSICLRELKWKTMPCYVVNGTPIEMEIIKYAENSKRADLTDIEEAHQLKKMLELMKKKPKDLAEHIGKSESYVKQKLKILDYPDFLYNAVAENFVSFSAARELVRITDENTLRDYVSFAIQSGITPAIAKQWADDWILRTSTSGMSPDEANKSFPNVPQEEPRFPCEVCNGLRKVSETYMMRVCRDRALCDETLAKKNN